MILKNQKKKTGDIVGLNTAYGWKCLFLMEEGVWEHPKEFTSLVNKLKRHPLSNGFHYVGILVLEPNGFLTVHSDTPIEKQLSVPLVQDEHFHFA